MNFRPFVLVVEDDDDVRELTVQVLRSARLDVVAVASGTEALDWFEATEVVPDVVVLDVQMPEMDGWTTLERIRASARTADVPVLLCTVKSRDEDRDHGVTSGCNAYLAKPYTIDDLVDGVRRLARVPASSRRL